MADLGRRRGYTLVAVDAAGVNAFFVRQDILECQKEQVGGCVVVVVVEVVVVCVCVCAGGGGGRPTGHTQALPPFLLPRCVAAPPS